MLLIKNKILILLSVGFLVSCMENALQPETIELQPETVDQQQTDVIEANVLLKHPVKNDNLLAEQDNNSTFKSASIRPITATQTNKSLDSKMKLLETSGSLPILKTTQQITPGIAKIINSNKTDTENDVIQLDYEQVELRLILEEIADSLGLSIVIDASVNTKITMRTAPQNPLKYDDLWPLLNMLLNESGISLEKKGKLYYAKKSPLFLPEEMGYAAMLRKNSNGKVMQITPLRNISIQSALAVVKPMVSADVKISQIAQINTLSIIATTEQLKKVNGLLSLIDIDPFKSRGIRLYKIKQAEVKKLVVDLDNVLQLIEGDRPAYEILALERISSLLVVAPPMRGFKSVDRWIDILDKGEDVALQEQIFIYKCKSVQCDSLASTLNSILNLNGDTQRKKDEVIEESISPNVFRTVPKDALSVEAKAKNVIGRQDKIKQNINKPSKDGGASADINVTIVADPDSNALLVRSTARDYRQLLQTIKLLDQVPLEVLVNVVLAQVTLSEGQSLGIDWSYTSSNGTMGTNLGIAQQVSSEGTPLGLILNRLGADWRVTLNAVAKDSDVNILSRPSLLIANNKEGTISVGKEVPVQTSETTNLDSGTGDTVNQVTQQIAYRKTGIEMTITPHINEDGIINMEIKQSLSSIEGATDSSDAGFKPTFGNQEINTHVITMDHQTIILGGLIESVSVYGETGVPIAKDVPIIGAFFKTQTEQIERRELILIITPKIIGRNTNIDEFNAEFNSRFNSVSKFIQKEINNKY